MSNMVRLKDIVVHQLVLILLTFVFVHQARGQEELVLYPKQIPNTKQIADSSFTRQDSTVGMLSFNVSVPRLVAYYPKRKKANGTAVIICPGGGYHVLLTQREGSDVAKDLNRHGITAYVLYYRLPSDKTMLDKTIGPLQDLQQAIRRVRQEAVHHGIDTNRIGVMGFSAGGHLAATAGVHYGDAKVPNPENIPLRPDFLLLVNPVIQFGNPYGHLGSQTHLLGSNPDACMLDYFSLDRHVDSQTPPTFLVHSATDEVVPVENSLSFFDSLRRARVPTGIHIYPKGEHGFLTSPTFGEWFGRCLNWMESMSLIPPKSQ